MFLARKLPSLWGVSARRFASRLPPPSGREITNEEEDNSLEDFVEINPVNGGDKSSFAELHPSQSQRVQIQDQGTESPMSREKDNSVEDFGDINPVNDVDKSSFAGLHPSRSQQMKIQNQGSGSPISEDEQDGELAELFDAKLEAVLERGKRHKIFWTEKDRIIEDLPPTGYSYEELKTKKTEVDCLAGMLSNFEPVKSSEEEKKEEEVTPVAKCQYSSELAATGEDKRLIYPIDNESLVWEESSVPFTDHISLAKYITLFPSETHQFMETIVSALQNNPDYTVDRKKAIIWGYLNYFNYYSSLLEDTEEIIKV